MASANAVSRHMGRQFTRSRRESEEGFSVCAGDDPGSVFVHYTCGDKLNRQLTGDEQRARIAGVMAQYTEHLRDRWHVALHPKLHNLLVLNDRSNLDDVASMVASRPADEQYAPLHVDTTDARIVRADEVKAGDTILAAVDSREGGFEPDWFEEPYTADPQPFDPTCQCGACGLADGETVVLCTDSTSYGPSLTCDPWPADRLVLIVPA